MIWTLIKQLFPPKFEVQSFGRTDTGKVRRHNEDAFCILARRKSFMVADGMGGHKAGDVASGLAIEYMAHLLSLEKLTKISGNAQEIRHFLVTGFEKVNELVMQKASEEHSCSGMGCTFITAIIDGGTFSCCHVGDVRCYHLRDTMRQLTQDHTYAAEFERANSDDPEATIKAPPRNIVSRAIGFPFPEPPEFNSLTIKRGDRFILCSDGLWSMLSDDIIEETARSLTTPEAVCDALIAQANEAGGKDNITVLAIFVT